jgi:hypothetical protein
VSSLLMMASKSSSPRLGATRSVTNDENARKNQPICKYSIIYLMRIADMRAGIGPAIAAAGRRLC